MKVNTFLLLSLAGTLCSSLHALKAQTLDERLIVGVSVGVALPQQNFGKSDTIGRKDTTKVKGWATTGINFNVKAGFRLSKYFGVMALAGGNVHGFNASAYLNQNYTNPILQGSVAVNATDYYLGSYLAGPFFSHPIGSFFAIEGRALAGVMTVKYSQLAPVVVFDGSDFNYLITYKPAVALGYDFGLALKYKIIDQIAITLSADYLGGNPAFSGYSVTYTGPTLPPPDAPAVNNGNSRISYMSTGIFNINAGAVFTFF